MRRRDLIALFGGAAAWPLAAHAQTGDKRRRVGLLDYSGRDVERVRLWDVFRKRAHELGYVEGESIVFEERWADGKADRLAALAAELVSRQPEAIVTSGTPSAQAALRATGTIPIVMATGNDPMEAGLSTSLARPSGNVTGVVTLVSELAPKRVELLREMLPHASRIASLIDTNNPSSERAERDTETTAKALGLALQALRVRGPDEVEAAFQAMLQPRVDALIVQVSALFFGERLRIADLALKHGLATVGSEISYAEAGCLATYGANFASTFRRAAEYLDKILKGAKPADLPVEQPTKFELVINLKTAKALGLDVPHSLMLRADEVIE